jgi:2-oxoglutarate ferredoxin oxidoreductase subunit alpha
MVRGGPGLGSIFPAQGDYFQATKGGGHGDYRMLVYTPANVQEMVDITYNAFDIADKYRVIVFILGDGTLAQVMEPIDLPEMKDPATFPKKDWAVSGKTDKNHFISTLDMNANRFEQTIKRLFATYEKLEQEQLRYEEYFTDDAETVIVAYGTVSRICKTAVNKLRAQGKKVGLLRPITVCPYPTKILAEIAARKHVKNFFVTELNEGQMLEDAKLAINGVKPVYFYGRNGGNVMTPEEIIDQINKLEVQ